MTGVSKYVVRDSAGVVHEVEATGVEIDEAGTVTFTKSGEPVAQYRNPPSWGPAPKSS